MNANPAAKSYLHTKIMTANPEELRLMLYDGAIKFCAQAKEAMDKKDVKASYHALTRAQKIVLELSTSLKHDEAPELCDKLASLYTFIYRRLVDANINRDVSAIHEALDLLKYEKETWQLLMHRLAEEIGSSESVDRLDLNGAQQTAISSLSTNA